VEREDELGGNLRHVRYLLDGSDPQEALRLARAQVTSHDRIRVWTGATIEKIDGSIGDFSTTLSRRDGPVTLKHGVVLVASGAMEYRPKEYLYGEDERVLTQRELEARLAGGVGLPSPNGKGRTRTVVMIQCVGSRDAGHPYCSRVCCGEAIKNALRIKALDPATHVYVLYRDVRTYGFQESYYTEARRQGVRFLRYAEDSPPRVSRNGHGLEVNVVDQTLGMAVTIPAVLVVLSAGMQAPEENRRIAQLLKVPLNSDGFFLEAHLKLRPVDFMTDGVFLCGLAHAPKTLDECVLQAQAAAARAATVLCSDSMELDAIVSEVLDESCDGCAYCVDTCPYQAITLIEYAWKGGTKKTVEADEKICKGCGCCQATCPKNGILVRGFTLEQIRAQIQAALEVA
jgi:heterodisulfide reductase subunit A